MHIVSYNFVDLINISTAYYFTQIENSNKRQRLRQEDAVASFNEQSNTQTYPISGTDDNTDTNNSPSYTEDYYYLRSSDDSEIDSVSQDDYPTSSMYNIDSRVQQVLTPVTSVQYRNFIKDKRQEATCAYERSNEIPADYPRGISSSSSTGIVKYPNHDTMKDAFHESFENKLGTDQRNAVRRIITGMKVDVSQEPSRQLLFFLSGAGGTGKSECIKLLSIAAKLVFGMKGPYEPLICVAPTGSAACNIDGYTWHSILNVERKNGILSQESAQKLASRYYI
jgi:hypothetical protein